MFKKISQYFLIAGLLVFGQIMAMDQNKQGQSGQCILPKMSPKTKEIIDSYKKMYSFLEEASEENRRLFQEVQQKMGMSHWYIHLFQEIIDKSIASSYVLNFESADVFNSDKPNVGTVTYHAEFFDCFSPEVKKAIFAHECAHIMCRHSLLKQEKKDAISKEKYLEMSQQHEKEADTLGCRKINLTKYLILYFDLLTLTSEEKERKTHPEGSDRIAYLLPIAKQQRVKTTWLKNEKQRIIAVKNMLAYGVRKGHPHALYLMGKLMMKESKKEALRYLNLAVVRGHTDAMYYVGKFFEKEGERQEAFRYFNLAAANGHAKAMYCVGKLFYSDKKYKQAKKILRKAFNRGYRKAILLIIEIDKLGKGDSEYSILEYL